MGLFRKTMQGRARWLVAFTLLLLAASAVPVLADPPVEEQVSEGEFGGGVDPSLLPDAEDLAKAEEQAEEEEADRAQELESPPAIAEREDSKLAYKDLESAAAVGDLLRSSFGEELANLELDPARVLTDASLKRNLGNDGGAVISSDGEPELIEAGIPAEVKDEDGDLDQVDLTLGATPEGFEPENPITEITIPTSPAEAVSIEDGEISIAQAGVDPESSAHTFGEKNVIYPEVQADTDLLVSPISSGVELFDQLRSPQSPETLRFDLDIPADAELIANGGAAEVWQDEKMTAFVSPPHAVDAQGTEVPVTMAVEGTSIALSVAHRESEYAYPILVDPEITQNDWVNDAWINYKRYDVLEDGTFQTWNNNPGLKASKWCLYQCWGSGRGLFVSFPSNGYAGNQQVQWTYTVPGETSYLSGYLINPFLRENHNCSQAQYSEPHDFDGLWSPALQVYTQLYTNRAAYGNAAAYENTGKTVKVMVFGMNSGNGVSLPCWRDIYAGGLATYMTDPDNPTLDPIFGYPTGWFDDSKTYSLNVSAHDKGLGVSNVRIDIGQKVASKLVTSKDCYGTHDSPCPRDVSGPIYFNGDLFAEGKSEAKVVASDALQRPSNIYPWTAYVDSTPPEVRLSGDLAAATEEEKGDGADPKKWDDLSLPIYNLKIEAEDGKKGSDATMRSGVKNIEIFLDEKTEPETVSWKAQGCSGPEYSCPMTVTYPLILTGLATGKHRLKVFAVDQMGHKRERDIEFEYIPATGMRDEYVMQRFPLPDGQGKEAEEEHPTRPELAVNVMNGNLAYREKDVDVPGEATDLEVERFYSSQMPNSANTEWGDGWTLAQTPELEPEAGATPKEAQLIDTSGALEDEVQLPTEVGKTKFDPTLQATVTKEAGGGYELADDSGETGTSIAFDASGRTDELRTESYAKVDYDYEAGKLDEIAIKDPGSASDLSKAEEEELEYVPPAPSFKSAFGVTGTGDGQLTSPVDIALAPNGDLFVLDWSLNRVQRFGQEGKYLSKFGTKGTATGQFSGPTSIAIDASGNLYVVDRGNNRIQKFNEKGEFIKAFGTAGSGNGQFSAPSSIAIDAKGNLYVADTSNQRIQKFNSSGEYLSKFGSYGKGNGQFYEPNNVDIGPGGSIWIADHSLNRVTEFNEAGGFVQTFGSTGSGDGQFNGADGIEVDSRGSIWVIDQGNGRVEQFSQAGKYLSKFGQKGTGSGQFDFTQGAPLGIAVDNKGGLWVADHMNRRIQKWGVPNYRPSWYGAFGTVGTGDGQVKTPADTAIAPNGDVFVLDKGNARVLRFNQEGKYLSKFGAAGTGNGQLKAPTSIAIDGSNNLWIADAGNYRIQEFTEGGEFVRAVGSQGTGSAQFGIAEGIATDLKGNVYVADTYNRRIQVFDEEGKYLSKFGSAGSGLGQFTEASSVDIGRHGNVYVADWGANKIQVFNEKGEPLLQFGSSGTGDGQFSHADAVEADSKGNVWVGDQSNGRIELFNEAGEYITQFGAKGSGEGQFSFTYPMGVTADRSGGLWITDVNNNRIQKWQIPNTDPPKPVEENDPSVDVALSAGLVSSVEGDEAGTNTYAHTGELLTANKGPDGETKYEYEAGRLKKVTLPNGTWGSIAYESLGRVSKVTVDPAGSEPAKTTSFSYVDSPSRTTTVTSESAPIVVYHIGSDGSVFKWQNVKKPPIFDNLYGSLYFSKETASPISPGAQILDIQAHADEGIASIRVVVNGSQLVDEESCNENLETKEVECKTVKDEWVMETEDFAPGILNLEVIIEDRFGEAAAQRFWVNIPDPPPPPPDGAPARPKFSEIANFRDQFGLDVVDPVEDEMERNGRIFDLINAWTEGDPVARATAERWGVPLRVQDVAEMEYRDSYVAHNGPLIQQWASSHASTTYGGYYVDHPAGGVLRIGFTSNQAALVAQLKKEVGLSASDRVATYSTPPNDSMEQLENLQMNIAENDAITGPLVGLITRVGIDLDTNRIKVGALNVSQVETGLHSVHGPAAPIAVYADQQSEPLEGHFTDVGPVRPGIAIGFAEENKPNYCTAGFAAKEKTKKINRATGQPFVESFLLTAGHCWADYKHYIGFVVRRFHSSADTAPSRIGTIARRSNNYKVKKFSTDGAAILIDSDVPMSSSVFREGSSPGNISGTAQPTVGMTIHKSGATSKKVTTGYITGPAEAVFYYSLINVGEFGPYFLVPATMPGARGDSGGPIWANGGRAVGLVAFGGPDRSAFSPLQPPELPGEWGSGYVVEREQAPGILHAPGMGPELHVATSP